MADNPLSNPEDHKHYISRVKREAVMARYRKEAEFGPATPRVPKLPKKVAFTGLRQQIDYGPLRAWMKAFAVWLISLEKTPSRDQQLRKATKLAKAPVSSVLLTRLRRRADFVEYLDRLQADAVETARAQYEAMFPMMTQLMHGKLEKAVENPDKNYSRAVEKIVQQGVERFAPKKADPDEQPRTIHIHLNARTQKLADAVVEPMPDVEVLKAGETE